MMGEVFAFTVNGQSVSTKEDKSLLRFLRDDLRLYSVKDGCSEGACGACTIIADQKTVRACVLKTSKAAGKKILTVEGLSLEEKEAFVYAFGSRGAVQCGFCIPGMVMSAKALLDQNPDPSDDEIKAALKGNICRCTGYVKIIEAIRLTGAILRGEEKINPKLEEGVEFGIGARAFRVDVRRKTLGYGKYPDDIGPEFFVAEKSPQALEIERQLERAGQAGKIAAYAARYDPEHHLMSGSSIARIDDPGCSWCQIVSADMPPMAYCSAVRSKYARARVVKIDSAKAEALPGVLGVLRAGDVPVNKVGHILYDWDVMIAEGEITRMCGDAICLVVAESSYILEEAKKLIEVEYEPLTPVLSPEEAAAPDAPKLHPERSIRGNLCEERHIVRGNPAQALARSRHVVTRSFETPFTEHAFLEPECAVSFPYKEGIKILSSDQGAYATRSEVAHMLDWDEDRVVVENQLIGGGFGGKEDVTTQHISALAAWIFQRPVKAKFSRQESISFHPKRHAMKGTFTVGCDENGILQALDCEFTFDTGAYASLCGPVLERACTHAVGPYCYENTDIRGYSYYTNNPPAGAFRGFGVCQTEFALECVLNELAKKVGISTWEIRYRNAIEPGKVLPNGQIADLSTALKEALEAVKPYYDANPGRVGIACAMKNSGVGVGLPDDGNALLRVENSVLVIYTCASDIGQGGYTVFSQAVSEATGLTKSHIRMGICSTENAPDSGTTSGSRQTLVTGEAIRGAAFLVRDAMYAASAAEEEMRREGQGDGNAGRAMLQKRILEILRSSDACQKPALADTGRAQYGTGTEYAPGTNPGPFVSPNMQIDEKGTIKGFGSGLNQGTYGKHGTQTRIHGSCVKDPVRALELLEGMSFSYRYFEPTDPLGANVPNPKSHIAYGYAACCAVLDEEGRVTDIYSAYDAGKVVNPISIQGQIEGGVLMGMGYACSEDFPLKDGRPSAKFGRLGLLRAPQIPNIHAIYVEKDELMGVSYGSKGIGEITTIPAAPAIAGAYYELDGRLRHRLPMDHTFYRKQD